MAQTNYTPIILYNSGTTGNTPSTSNLASGELAINYTDGKLFYKDNSSTLQVIGWKTTPTTAGGTGLTSYTAGDLPYYASGTALSKLGIGTSGYVLESNGSAPTWVAQSTLSVGSATNATNTAITDNTSSSSTWYPTIVSATTGNLPQTTSSTKFSFVPSTGVLTTTGQNITGLTASSAVATDASKNLISVTNTGTGNNVLATSPTLVTPLLGTPTSGTLTNCTGLPLSSGVTGTLPVGNGGTGITSLTSQYIPYGNGSSAFSSSSNLQFDGTNLIASGGGAYFGSSSSVGSGFITVKFNSGPNNGITMQDTATSGYGQYVYFVNSSGAQAGLIAHATSTTVLYTSTSDRRLKTNIADITTEQSGPIIDALQPRSFNWTIDNTTDVGFIADEFQNVIPRAVVGQPNAVDSEGNPKYQSIESSTSEMIAYLVAEVKSIRSRLKNANIA